MSDGGASSYLQRLEEAERRKSEMEARRSAKSATAAAAALLASTGQSNGSINGSNGHGTTATIQPLSYAAAGPPHRSISVGSAGSNGGGYKDKRPPLKKNISNNGSNNNKRNIKARSQRRNGTYVLMTLTLLTASIGLNVAHHSILSQNGKGVHNVSLQAAERFMQKHFSTVVVGGEGSAKGEAIHKKETETKVIVKSDTKTNNQGSNKNNKGPDGHILGGLSCAAYGGPSDEIASQMVYWSDIPTDAEYVSPFKKEGESKYMTFEPDGGGWNNIRMAMETVVALAHATGRTLVMPPEQRMYLLGKGTKEHKKHFGFADFYHLESLSAEHAGLDIISMEEFLNREAMTGKLKSKTSGQVMFPPGNRTNWDGSNAQGIAPLKDYLREVTLTPLWKPDKCMAAFPSASGPTEIERLNNVRTELVKTHDRKSFEKQDQSAPDVLGPVGDRMRENILGRELCVYDEEMQAAPVVHFMCYHKMKVRLLVHFYAFLFFESALQDLWTKRFVRDHLRYKDEMQCAAARAVDAIRGRARSRDPSGNPDGLFDSLHVRRGDFQYKKTRVDADVLYAESKDQLTENATVFVATDERDKSFFQPLRDHYDLVFLDDYMHLFKDMNPNNFGMMDQLIASKGRVFFGTYHSTFTGWINRMRGYYIDKHELEGSADGTMESYYFVPSDKKMCMKSYSHIHQAFFAREYPVAWRDLDKGIDPLATEMTSAEAR